MRKSAIKGFMTGLKLPAKTGEFKRGINTDMIAAAEALLETQSDLNPNLAGPNHSRDIKNQLGNFIY